MLIDIIFQTCKTFINTDGNGNFRPIDFELALHNTVCEKYENYLFEINQMVNRENRGLINGGLENVPDRIREKLLHYLKIGTITKTSGLYNIPTDLKYFDTVYTPEGYTFEFQKSMQQFDVVKNVAINKQFPIAIKIGNKIKVAPDTIANDLTIYYLRVPLFAKWTYNIIQGNPVFNPSASDFVDVDIHVSETVDIIKRVCFYFGLNLKDTQIQNAMMQTENIEYNQNNAS